MKKLVALAILILFPAGITLAQSPYHMLLARRNVSAAGCTTLEYTLANNTTAQPIGSAPGSVWIANKIGSAEMTSGFTLCRLECELVVTAGTPTYTITAYIYADVTGSPDTSPLATSTSTVSGADVVAGGQAFYSFNFAGLALSSSTDYWAVLSASSDASNNVGWMRTTLGPTEIMLQSADGVTFGALSTSRQAAMKMYSE